MKPHRYSGSHDGGGGFARAPEALPNIELTRQALDVIADFCGAEVWVSALTEDSDAAKKPT